MSISTTLINLLNTLRLIMDSVDFRQKPEVNYITCIFATKIIKMSLLLILINLLNTLRLISDPEALSCLIA